MDKAVAIKYMGRSRYRRWATMLSIQSLCLLKIKNVFIVEHCYHSNCLHIYTSLCFRRSKSESLSLEEGYRGYLLQSML